MGEQERKKETALTSKFKVEKRFPLQPEMRETMAVETLGETRRTVAQGGVASAMLHWLSKKQTLLQLNFSASSTIGVIKVTGGKDFCTWSTVATLHKQCVTR